MKKFKPKLVSSLLGLHQRHGESLRDFLERYNSETLLVKELQTQAAILTLLSGLQPGPFKTELSKRLPRPAEEIQIRVEKYIFLEEIEKATANPKRHQSDKKTGGQDEHPRKDVRARAGKYSEYTPLNVSLSELFREVGQVERFPKPKILKMRANTNKSLFCEYHNGFGHKTEDCYDLRDAVE